MKAIGFGNRLARDLDVKSVIDLTADGRLEILDAINGGLQAMHALAPHVSKETTGGITLDAPVTISIGVTTGSTETTGNAFSTDQIYRTVRIGGDGVDNQIVGVNELLHPYGGATGTVDAVIYCDGVAVPEPYEELIGDPLILETDERLTNCATHCRRKNVAKPCYYTVEANARNQNPSAPAVIRFDSLPDRLYRLEAKFTLAPARISFADLLAPGSDIPLRTELVEVYLLPIARGLLTSSSLWKDPSSKAEAKSAASLAEQKYEVLTPRHLSTPNNKVRTKRGW